MRELPEMVPHRDKGGNVEESLTHSIASVFCPSELRRRGYASRHMKDILYSDIGGQFYAGLGCLPRPENRHFVLPPAEMDKPAMAQLVGESELEALCLRDEDMIRKVMAAPSAARTRVVILSSRDHMLWHNRKEDFVTDYIFGKKPHAKNHHDEVKGHFRNVLYVLRLVVEGDETANKPYERQLPPLRDAYAEQAAALKTVLKAAQAEAAAWGLDEVNLWEASPLMKRLVEKSGLDATWVERQEDGIACARWASEGGDGADEPPFWLNNEYYAWC
ncbi:N-acetyltransferase-like protein [Metarhizium guizhouense ARSEF 977]|uniref:N-acetyltransferase-like protein n=1 Tax=Metarhizium guizhouense (strain ARSEF 977) TaxID=1276136 RepID=A0A0B4G699_METGA|nr:N-acetyltransferase-like protein [Metarhizium guizhouense ARSEF 977]